MDREGVVATTLSAGTTAVEFASAWAAMLQYDANKGRHCLLPGGSFVLSSGPRIAEARSQIVDEFFANWEAKWLLMIDSDMIPPMDLLDRMMAVANPITVPVLGGLCFAGGRTQEPYPTIYKEVLVEKDGKSDFVAVEPVKDYPRDTLMRVGATGAACLLVHRRILAAMSQPWPKGYGTLQDGTKNPYPWFIEGLVGPEGEPFGEDVAFCRRLHQMSVPIHVHTGIKLGHVKSYVLDEAYYDRYRSEEPKTNGEGNRAERRRAAREALKAS